MTSTKFKASTLFWVLWMLLGITGLLFFMVKAFLALNRNEILPILVFELFFGALLLLSITVLKEIKHIKVNPIKREIRYYNLFAPLGKTIKLNQFKGIIKIVERTYYKNVNTIHFVDNNKITRFKINGSIYSNFDEIMEAIQLEEIKDYDFGFRKYLQLIITGKIKITNTK